MDKKSTKQKMQTLINAEEQHLAQMSTTTTTTTTASSSSTLMSSSTTSSSTTTSKKKKVSSKKITAIAESTAIEAAAATRTTTTKALASSANALEELAASEAAAAATTKTTKMKSSKIAKSEKVLQQQLQQQQLQQQQSVVEIELHEEAIEQQDSPPPSASPPQQQQIESVKKEKSKKKQKKDKQLHKTLKASFNKFDALEKREQQIQNGQNDRQSSNDCRLCQKPVYKMEEIKAEKSIYHKNCFRCNECAKPLKVDNYQSHEGTLYCIVHFKLLFAPKCIEDATPERPRKPELIIRESQPVELPPDVARSSDKPDLGLAELQQLNLRSKFQLFESGQQQQQQHSTEHVKLTRNVSLKTKLAKLQAHGLNTNGLKRIPDDENASSASEENDDDGNGNDEDEDEENGSDDDSDAALNIDCPKRERPIGIGHAMHDIKTKFERGPTASKEERREERKLELQNIRSRLFMGKQARIKEMYQQAVAESEQGITSSGKKIDIDVGKATQLIKARFETGDIYGNRDDSDDAANDDDIDDDEDGDNNNNNTSSSNKVRRHTDENRGHASKAKTIQNDAEVFESAISKQSRNIFMELDANLNANERNIQQNIKRTPSTVSTNNNNNNRNRNINEQDIIKCDESADGQNDEEQRPSTNELSEKFKFFETYQPQKPQRKQFRITPPREGVVKMPTPPRADGEAGDDDDDDEKNLIEKSQTTSRMLNKFRQIEQQGGNDARNGGPKPLKRFTPPPDGDRRYYQNVDSDYDDEDDDEEDDDEEEEEEEDEDVDGDEWQEGQYQKTVLTDAALAEAKALARTQQLRKKFEKWEIEEKERERNENNQMDVYSKDISDDTNIESTKTIRQHFENLKNAQQQSPASKVRYQVNRFV